jgi:hypothetical protein
MISFLLGMLGAVVGLAVFRCGVILGMKVGRKAEAQDAKDWIDEHACYTCSEMWDQRHAIPYDDEDEDE